jgi:hypothetical protein
MIALLRQVAQPDNSESAKWADMRIHRISSDVMVELGYSSKLNAEWEFCACCATRGGAPVTRSCEPITRIWGCAPPSASTSCSRVHDTIVRLDASRALFRHGHGGYSWRDYRACGGDCVGFCVWVLVIGWEIVGRDTRMRSEKSCALSAACAASLIRDRRRSSSNGSVVSTRPE